MTAPRNVALTEEGIKEAAKNYAIGWLPSNTVGGTFEAGARFAREFYEKREALWSELVKLASHCERRWASGQLVAREDLGRLKELRAALGLEG